MATLIPFMWLAIGLTGTVPLSGTVVDAGGRPVAGASVWLSDTIPNRQGVNVLAAAETDPQGRFQLERADDLKGRGDMWSPTLWAYKPGARVAFHEFKGKLPKAEDSVRLELGAPTSRSIQVLQADGKPAPVTRVRPVLVKLKAPRLPDALLDRLAVTTNGDGRATLDGFLPDDLFAIRVNAPGQPLQSLPIDPDTGIIRLRPLGKLKVRLVGDEPKALQGWAITAASRPIEPGYQGPYTTHWIRKRTRDDGQVEFPNIAEGQVIWTIKAPAGSNDIVVKEPGATIRAGQTESVEIVVQRGVRVEGTVREEATGKPVAGVKVDVDRAQMGSRMVQNIVTNAQGRFSKLVLPGTIEFSYDYFDLPKAYYLPPRQSNSVRFEVKAGEDHHEFSPPPLKKAAMVRGVAIDEAGNPVAGVSVIGSLEKGEYEGHAQASRAETDDRGEFVLGGMIPGTEVRVSATWKSAADVEPVTVPKAGEGGPITLHIRKRRLQALSGRVLGAKGQPVAGASVRVTFREPGQRGNPGNDFGFNRSEAIRTNSDGRFRTPAELPIGNAYRVEVEATGYEPEKSVWVEPPGVAVPDVTLRPSPVSRLIDGRVIDTAGKPVAGAEVFQSGSGKRKTQSTTDANGRFRLSVVDNATGFVFVVKEGYHFVGRRVEQSAKVTLRRLNEPAEKPLQPAVAPVSRDEERAIARGLLADARKRIDDGEHRMEEAQILEAMALVDPDMIMARIENQVIKAEPNLLAELAVARSETDPTKALEVVDSMESPPESVFVALALYDRLGTTATPAFRRELLDRIARRAGEVADLAPMAATLNQTLQAASDNVEETLEAIRGKIVRQMRERSAWMGPNGTSREERQRKARRIKCFRLAAKDYPAAKVLAAEDHDPMVEALLPAIAARSRAQSDPAEARRLLRESVDRLAKLGDGLSVQPSPANALARLLPMAVRIDPDRSPDIFWLAVSRRVSVEALWEPVASNPTTLHHYLDLIELSVLLARYDRATADAVFAPVADQVRRVSEEAWGIGNECPAIFRAAGAFDARAARSLLESLPEDPAPIAATSFFRFPKQAQVRIALARMLGLPPSLRLREPFLPNGPNWLTEFDD